MNMKVLSSMLGIALAVVGGLAIQFSREVESGREKIAALEKQLQQQQAELAALAARPLAQPAPSSPVAGQGTQPVAATQPPSPQAPSPTLAATNELLAAVRAQMQSPEGMARRRQTSRQLMTLTNPDIDEALGLTPEETTRLLDLLVVQQERSSSVFDQARQETDQAAARELVQSRLQENRATSDTELQQLLGSRYPQWQDYQQTRAAWSQRRDLRAVLSAAGTPMTQAQERSLIAALSAEQRSFSQSQDAARQPFSANTPERQQRRLDAVAPHLSTQQLESYRAMLERAAAQERALRPALTGAASTAD